MNYEAMEYAGLNFKTSSFVDILKYRAEHSGDKVIFTFLSEGDNRQESISYAELDEKARQIAACLQSLKLKGERALLLYPPGLQYIAGFFGCLYAGLIAVPAYPPSPAALERSLPRLEAISKDAEASLVLTTEKIKSLMQVYFGRMPQSVQSSRAIKKWNESAAASEINRLNWIATDSLEGAECGNYREMHFSSKETAFLQYTSGSTGSPKGVNVSHGNLIHNSALIKDAFGIDAEKMEVVLWLPFYHDMGLIGGVLQPVFSGIHARLMSPISFLSWPLRWLQIISSVKDKSVISGGPNFAYELCLRKLSPEQIESLNLSRWDIAFTAAEPVRAETIENFSNAFRPSGFRKEAFFPCYGMAETTLMVTGKSSKEPPVIEAFGKKSLQGNIPSKDAGGSGDTPLKLVGCGKAAGDLKVIIVNPETGRRCPNGEIGEIWVSGASVANGYWKKREETLNTFHALTENEKEGPFLRSGDLGFLDENGELFITGRKKDLIIIRGRNFYPQDIERTVEKSHPSLRPSCVAAFSIEEGAEERLVVVQEISAGESDPDEIIEKIRGAINEEHEILAYSIVLIKARTIAKTSSGKIQRQEIKKQYLSNSLGVIKESKLSGISIKQKSHKKEEALDLALRIKDNPDINNVGRWLINALSSILKTELQNISPGRPISSFGMDSLMMVELKNDIESKLGISISISEFFQNSTFSKLSYKIVEQMSRRRISSARVIPVMEKREESVLSYGQKSLWFMQQLEPGNAAYNVFFAAKIQSELDVSALRKSLDIIVERHASLRTVYVNNGSEPVQKIQASGMNYFSQTDAKGWKDNELREKIISEAHLPFDLGKGPLFRASLFDVPDGEHILLLNFHHIAVDLWSIVILLSELRALYPAIKRGEKPELEHTELQYTDFANWQKTYLEGPEGRKSLDYWKHQLSGELPVVNLPFDKARPPVKTYNGAVFSFQINNKITNRLKTIVRDENSTLYILLLSAFNILLSKYTNQDEIIVGSPGAGRTHSELENIVGYFVNSMVIRSQVKEDLSFREYLHGIRKTVLEALDHQDYPFSLLVEKMQHYRGASRSPFFDVMFVLERPHLLKELGLAGFILSDSGAKINIGGLKMESYYIEQKVAQFDLTLSIVEKADSLSASFQFNTDLFEKGTISQMAEHFRNLLTEIAENPQKRISEMSLVSKMERNSLVNMWNSVNNNFQEKLLIHELFEEYVGLNPQAVAVKFDGSTVTYGQLNHLAEKVKSRLERMNLPAETPVGIYSRRSIEIIAGILGIFKAGLTYIPLDPEYPEERTNYMIGDAGISVVLTQAELSGRIRDKNLEAVILDDIKDEIMPQAYFSRSVEPEGTAYVIYTSGSTGKPKGVMVSHQALANHCRQIKNSYKTTEKDRVLEFSSMNFDASLEQIFTTLISGATLVLKDEELLSPKEFLEMLNSEEVSVLNLPPSYFEQLVSEWAKYESLNFHRLRLVIVGGDVLYFNTIKKWFTLAPVGIKLINAYGPTETTITSVAGEIGPEVVRDCERSIPIGKPQANRTAYILDSKGNLAPRGVIGELYIGGSCLARGYTGKPDLTAEKFIPDAFSKSEGQRLYKTGDLARYIGDGSLEFIGRVDHQVKIRGFRIELGEIETVLHLHPSVEEAVAVLKQNARGDKSIAVYIVPGENYNISELKNYLRQQLPDFLIPSFFVKMEHLPLTPAGKIDRRALSAFPTDFTDSGETYKAPQTPLEKNIAGIISEVLGVQRVGLYDNFFDLGGHSLLAIKTLSRINSFYKIELTVRQMFENPTVAGLADAILSRQLGTDQDELKEMLSNIENLSDDEVRKLLGE
ncbi:MAG: amino acid adenylation domain-containing protein [Ignavibacteria bacterium]|jgi:amino acid adenylation domain-containing protein|nr:amino acid adenylation domain-containing protein [Ignavibacteria bacterium]MCU7505204.1 amino acid adenylation domain-containing protein [Ignavibacteria bacterium]MCU7518107.1 amino acid adenylation domain-containing protein [Ignavibacteria bacterium]